MIQNKILSFTGKKKGRYRKNHKVYLYQLLPNKDFVSREISDNDTNNMSESQSWQSASELLFGKPIRLRTRKKKDDETENIF